MMLSNIKIALSLLAGLALAAPSTIDYNSRPPILVKKNTCAADNCLRAVRATNASPFASSATADCVRFQVTTVTPCPFVVTVTASTTLAAAASVVTSYIEETASITIPTTTVETATSITLTTITVTAQAKRDIQVQPLPVVPATGKIIKKRVDAPTCSAPAVISSSLVPTYASACSGTVRYKSACSCAGIPATSITLSQATVTSTFISTIYTTPVTTTQVTTTDATQIVLSTTTTTTTTVSTSVSTVVVAAAPTCSNYYFVNTAGFRAGQYISGTIPSDPTLTTYGFVNFNSDPTTALPYYIRADGRVYTNSAGYAFGWVTNGASAYYILQMTDASQATYGIRSVTCSLDTSLAGTSALLPGAVGTISCTSNGSPVTLEYCPQFSNNLAQVPGTSVTAGCTAAALQAIPAPC